MFIGILACYLLMYCKFIKKNRHEKVGGVRFHTIYMFVALFYFRLRKLVVLLYKIKSRDGGVVLHICSGIKCNLVKCKEKLCSYLVCGCCSLVASGLTCWLVSETISTFNLSINREEAVVFV